MNSHLLDTHIWFWYLTGSQRLPVALKNIIDDRDSLSLLSPISVWEIGLLANKGRIILDKDFNDWLFEANKLFPVKEAPLNIEIAKTSLEIDLAHPDPADRFISATALVYDVPLLTVDDRLCQSGILNTISA